MLSAKWDAFCNGTKITELLQLGTTEGVTEFERGLCALNWTVIMEELVSYNPNMQIYIDEVRKSPLHIIFQGFRGILTRDATWVRASRNIPEYKILRLTFCGKSASKT